MTFVKRSIAAATLAATLLSPVLARAEVKLTVGSLFGKELQQAECWGTVLARLENTDDVAVRGHVEIKDDLFSMENRVSRAPYSLAPHSAMSIRVPVRPTNSYQVSVKVLDERGKTLASESLNVPSRKQPLLVDMHTPSRLVPALRGTTVNLTFDAGGMTGGFPLSVVGVWFDPATGDPTLPERTAEWQGATAVVASSDTLSRLSGPELEALSGYVLSGGTLAVIIRRPEDLHAPLITALAGGDVQSAGLASHLNELMPSPVSRQQDSDNGFAQPTPTPTDDGRAEPEDAAPKPTSKPLRMSDAVRDSLALYEGGNLQQSDFGATAAYGLGEVHMLAFDPTRAPGVDDPWVQAQMIELMRHAWDRQPAIATRIVSALSNMGPNTPSDLRKQLDPNEGARWAIVLAALLLLGYAAVAGPINYSQAVKAGKPLNALRNLLVLSAGTFTIIVAIAVFSKGVRGEARRLSFIEVSGGMSRGVIQRYRALFTPRAKSLDISATDPGTVLDVLSSSKNQASLSVEREGLRLVDIPTLPWETLIVREEGVVSLGGGITLAREGSDVRITNRTAHDLRGLIVSVPSSGFYTLTTLKDGESALASSGTLVTTTAPGGSVSMSSKRAYHPFGLSAFNTGLRASSPELPAAWDAIQSLLARSTVDWWPEDQPVLLAQIDGGEGQMSDTGLKLVKDRQLVRVIGFGGTP